MSETAPKPRNAYDRIRVSKTTPGESLTKQDQADDCNINFIMQKYQKTGLLDHIAKFEGQYGDFTEAQDFQTSLNQVRAAEELFMTLPSSVRKRFHNQPGEFIEFVSDPVTNAEEMQELGLLPKNITEPAEGGAGGVPPESNPPNPAPAPDDAPAPSDPV